jgi:hypothetical protein
MPEVLRTDRHDDRPRCGLSRRRRLTDDLPDLIPERHAWLDALRLMSFSRVTVRAFVL